MRIRAGRAMLRTSSIGAISHVDAAVIAVGLDEIREQFRDFINKYD